MRGYLLDNNHIGALFRKDASVLLKLRSIPVDWQIRVCSVTLGEIEAGHRMTEPTDHSKRDDYERFVNENFLHHALEISIHTRETYAEIIARIWEKYPPANPKKRTEQHLVDLGVDINDVWAVAVAWEHGLTFVTADKMACIREVVGDEVQFENWLEKPLEPTHRVD